ncbi:hypothetical protein D9M71_229980 [compost metagenome]
MSEHDERHESEHECPGCGQQFNGFGTLSHHTERCQKALAMLTDDCERCGGWGWIDADPDYSGDCPECKP